MRRRSFMAIAGAGALLAGAGYAVGTGLGRPGAPPATRPLPVIPEMDLTGGVDGRVRLELARAAHDFGTGAASETFGVNMGYLGPVVRARQGQTLPFDVANGTGEPTTLHWHGLHIPGAVDGGPHQEIEPGATWSPDVPIVQHASMNWYHSHAHGRTAQQVYKGLAGVLLVEDDASLAADLPRTYGVDDLALVLQDKMFDDSGRMEYPVSAAVFEDGLEADTLVVNGALAPVGRAVPAGLVRLRILNACNARFLALSMAAGPLHVIASDGGFLASTVETDRLLISPGERYEVLVDMRAAEANSLQVAFPAGGNLPGPLGGLLGGGPVTALALARTGARGFDGAVPGSLANLPPPDPSAALATRSFELQVDTGADLAALAASWGNVCGGGAMAINGKPMRMDRIDEEVSRGDTEIWRIAVDDMHHPFHIHGCSFRILSQHGAEPPAYARGWKDMVHVENGWSEVLVRFDHAAPADAPYMYHCHILEHEDCGMMGQFTVS